MLADRSHGHLSRPLWLLLSLSRGVEREAVFGFVPHTLLDAEVIRVVIDGEIEHFVAELDSTPLGYALLAECWGFEDRVAFP